MFKNRFIILNQKEGWDRRGWGGGERGRGMWQEVWEEELKGGWGDGKNGKD